MQVLFLEAKLQQLKVIKIQARCELWIWRVDFKKISLTGMLRGEDRRNEQYFLDIYLTTFFGVHNFKNISAMRVIFFLKMLKIETKFPKCKKKFGKGCLFLR